MSDMREHIGLIPDSEVKAQAEAFCDALSEGIVRLRPEICISPMFADIDDEEAYFEWIFDDFRFGFSFRHESAESCWFLVSLGQDGDVERSSGDFEAGAASVVEYVLNHIARNS